MLRAGRRGGARGPPRRLHGVGGPAVTRPRRRRAAGPSLAPRGRPLPRRPPRGRAASPGRAAAQQGRLPGGLGAKQGVAKRAPRARGARAARGACRRLARRRAWRVAGEATLRHPDPGASCASAPRGRRCAPLGPGASRAPAPRRGGRLRAGRARAGGRGRINPTGSAGRARAGAGGARRRLRGGHETGLGGRRPPGARHALRRAGGEREWGVGYNTARRARVRRRGSAHGALAPGAAPRVPVRGGAPAGAPTATVRPAAAAQPRPEWDGWAVAAWGAPRRGARPKVTVSRRCRRGGGGGVAGVAAPTGARPHWARSCVRGARAPALLLLAVRCGGERDGGPPRRRGRACGAERGRAGHQTEGAGGATACARRASRLRSHDLINSNE